MKYNPEIHHRRSIRLKGYDYSQSGTYFITLCSHNREYLFGELVNDEMALNKLGIIARDEWIKSFQIRPEIIMDKYIVMPNHLHSIVVIRDAGDRNRDKLNKGNPRVAPTGPKNKSIGALVAGFKSVATKKINDMRGTPGAPVWQRNYHEHIIRNEESLEKIREYVINNPRNWKKDSLFL